LTRDLIDDAAWALIALFLPPERGLACRPSIGNRRLLEGIVWTRAHWRDLPECFGKSNTVWRRFARWRDAGVIEGILEALVASGAGDGAIQMIDCTVIRADQHSARAKRGQRI
jgi:transposase